MKIRNSSMALLAVFILLAGSYAALAQTDPKVVKSWTVAGGGNPVAVISPEGWQTQSTFAFVSSEMSFDAKTVTGVPFSADGVSEFTQILSNGQRIYRKTTSSLYRDSAGRTRREQTINAIGAYASAGPAHQTIIINDPVAGIVYILNPEDHSATKAHISVEVGSAGGSGVMIYRASGSGVGGAVAGGVLGGVTGGVAGGVAGGVESKTTTVTINGAEVHTMVSKADSVNSRQESLGVQAIEGVQAEGTRTIETIPAGSIGNDAPIEIISERWFSPELGVVVRTRHSDPRSGENVYQLTNIRRSEPPAGLFQIPADYTVKEGAGGNIQVIKKETTKK